VITRCLSVMLIVMLAGCSSYNKRMTKRDELYMAQDRTVRTLEITGVTEIKGDNIRIVGWQIVDPLAPTKTGLETIAGLVEKVIPFAGAVGLVAVGGKDSTDVSYTSKESVSTQTVAGE